MSIEEGCGHEEQTTTEDDASSEKPPMTDLATIVKTLRHLAGGWVENRADQEWLHEAADEIEHRDLASLMTCPLCQETACDEGCPMEPHRWDYYTWQATTMRTDRP